MYHNSNFYLHKILIRAVKKKTSKKECERTFARDLCVKYILYFFSSTFSPLAMEFSFHFVILVFLA